ncbi:hypothetical protein D8771_15685 [Streptomyces albus]|uniref:Uncharacterized protein n=1 Tax=Streptomyces albus TaxID=1888 RepID=A0A8H1QQX3_9ACTN|nr:hypothetical protein D8771_15685 [Streptomyces albus]
MCARCGPRRLRKSWRGLSVLPPRSPPRSGGVRRIIAENGVTWATFCIPVRLPAGSVGRGETCPLLVNERRPPWPRPLNSCCPHSLRSPSNGHSPNQGTSR